MVDLKFFLNLNNIFSCIHFMTFNEIILSYVKKYIYYKMKLYFWKHCCKIIITPSNIINDRMGYI